MIILKIFLIIVKILISYGLIMLIFPLSSLTMTKPSWWSFGIILGIALILIWVK